jgi:Protein of unknown function (DUF4239)
MIDWLLTNVPMLLLTLLVIIVPSLVAMAAVWFVRRWVHLDALAANNDVGAALFGITGTIYAIFLGFTVVLVWQELGDSEAIAENEASAIISLYHTARSLPEPTGPQLQQQLRTYTVGVRDVEWETMAYGEASPQVEDSLAAVWQTLTQADPRTDGQSALYSEAVNSLSDLTRQRLLRLQASEASVSSLFWAVLLGGAVVTIGLACFFGMPSVRTQAVVTGLMTAMIMSGLFLTLVLDRPFTGSVRADPEVYDHALALMDGPGRPSVLAGAGQR